jgi:cell wall-associated NlpC family hydrolase
MTDKVKLMLNYALSLLSRPYRWGGDDPLAGFDCSGYVQECLASIGLDPKGDQTAQGLYDHFAGISEREAGPGSLVFFGSSTSKISHVALLWDSEHMLEYGGGGPNTTNLQQAIEQNAYGRMRPITSRKDVVAILKPRYL